MRALPCCRCSATTLARLATDTDSQRAAVSALGEPIAHLKDAARLLHDFEKLSASGATRPEKRGRDGNLLLEVGTRAAVISSDGTSEPTDVGVVTKVSNGYYHVRFCHGQRCYRRHQLSALVEPERQRPRSAEPASSCADTSLTGMIGHTIFLTDGRTGLCESVQRGNFTVKLYTSSARVVRVTIRSAQVDLERTQAHAAATSRPVSSEAIQTSDGGDLLNQQGTKPSCSASGVIGGDPTKTSPALRLDEAASRALQRLTPEAQALLFATARRLGAKNGKAGEVSRQSYQLTKPDMEELHAISAAQPSDGFLVAPSAQQRGVPVPAQVDAERKKRCALLPGESDGPR